MSFTDNKRNHQLNYPPPEVTDAERNLKDYAHRKSSFRKRQCFEINPRFYLTGIFWVLQLQAVFWTQSLGTLRFATTDGWTRVARCLGDWIEYGALWRVVARKLKLSCYTTNYVLREIAAVEFTLKMSFQKVRDELIYCFADGILDEEEFVLLYDAYKSTNSIYPYWEYDEFSLDSLSSDECLADFRPSSRASSSTYPSI